MEEQIFDIDIKEFKIQYSSWLRKRHSKKPSRILRHKIIKKGFEKFVSENPKLAAKMLVMYYQTCGGISK